MADDRTPHAAEDTHVDVLPTLRAVVLATEREHIVRVLAQARGHRRIAASVLAISRKHLWVKIREHAIAPHEYTRADDGMLVEADEPTPPAETMLERYAANADAMATIRDFLAWRGSRLGRLDDLLLEYFKVEPRALERERRELLARQGASGG